MINKDDILEILANIKDEEGNSITSSNLISSIIIKDKKIGFVIDSKISSLKDQCKTALQDKYKDFEITIILSEHCSKPEDKNDKDLKYFMNKNKRNKTIPKRIDKIKEIITIVSGKGGVGKSTVTVSLAVELAKKGKKVGIVDADIYGPSIAQMMGNSEKPEHNDKKIIPLQNHGVKYISIANLMNDEDAVIWRGPMASKALFHLLSGVCWEELDYLLIDMPPGTNDIPISLVENFIIDGAIIVSTPQKVALADAKRAYKMLTTVKIPVLGIIENMSYYKDISGTNTSIFGTDEHIAKFANEENISVLTKIPLDGNIANSGDTGTPLDLKIVDKIFC